ncbi:hypothetical protein DFP95_12835 [Cohnella lupini]|uniref:Uncharacterized protein n=1 Tax=Cohnella lupini TaxID=1294267 RepID=A0A3D9HVP4_9BACL|nr:hypothetical protein DFP95_12835 [Cohnella lupini]
MTDELNKKILMENDSSEQLKANEQFQAEYY